MERWMICAFLAMLFAGITGVLAKAGLQGISSDLGLVVRTVFVMILVLIYGAWVVPHEEWKLLTAKNLWWLGASALATALSWIFYYEAIQDGRVSTVALIDKGSFLVAVLLSALFLGEALTWPIVIGSSLILSGIVVVARG